jgi:hypothetical protein
MIIANTPDSNHALQKILDLEFITDNPVRTGCDIPAGF